MSGAGQWGELIIRLPESLAEQTRPVNGQWLRSIARTNSEHVRRGQLPQGFFARDEQGRAIPGPAPVRWIGNQRKLVLQALGEPAVDMLAEHGHKVTRALARHFEQPLAEQFREGKARASGTDRMMPYHVPWLCFPSSRRFKRLGLIERCARKEEGLEALIRKELARLIEKGLVEMANERYVMDLPEFEIGDLSWEAERMLPTKRLEDDRQMYHLALKNVSVLASVNLHGPWAVGGFRSYGFGGIRAGLPDAGER